MAPRLRSTSASASALHNVVPGEALRVIWLALPVDARARAACVCRSWRAFLSDVSLWLQLDLTPAGGVAAERVTENLVRGAVARAAGRLRELSLNRLATPDLFFGMSEFLVELIVSDGAELQQVNTEVCLRGVAQLKAVFAASPRLQVLNAGVEGQCKELISILRNDPPYGVLRVHELDVWCEAGGVAADDVLALAAAVAAHDTLDELILFDVPFAPGLNALLDAAAERRVSRLRLDSCVVDAETVPALVRLLQRGSLTWPDVACVGFPLAPEASVLELCAALRACQALIYLRLYLNPQIGVTRCTVTELLDVAAALPELSELDLSGSNLLDKGHAGHALGALLRANLPSLRVLSVGECRLGDEGMAALLAGLAANTHLRLLECENNSLSAAFKRDRLAPALAVLKARAERDA
jgi:hypothetical protein